jgi:hypothetical protein
VELGDGSFRLKKSFEAADKVARSIVILGEDELQSGILTVKDFTTGTQSKGSSRGAGEFLKSANLLGSCYPTLATKTITSQGWGTRVREMETD